MKSIKDWIEESSLSKKDKELFYKNMKALYEDSVEYNDILNHLVSGFADALASAFIWENTKEGFEYWNKFACDPKLNKNNIE